MLHRSFFAVETAAIVVLLLAVQSSAIACPFCGPPQITLSEQLARSDVAVLLQWVSGVKDRNNKQGNTTFEIRQIVRNTRDQLKTGERITLTGYKVGNKGDLFFSMGKVDDGIQWEKPVEVTEISFGYITQTPSPETPSQKRLAYFLKFLEFSDPLIANDAFYEFANAPYKDVVPLADKMSRDRIRKWLQNENTPQNRLGLYGLMLGLCGNKEDARWLEEKISASKDEFRLGIDGIIGGYLVLTGEKGLDFIERTRLTDHTVSDGEAYAVMQALRFLWEYDRDRFDRQRLKKSMRLLLNRPDLAELVIRDLARWKDWSVQDRLMKLYGSDGYDDAGIRRAIVGYMLVSTRDTTDNNKEKPAPHVVKGREYIASLRKKDPKTVKQIERVFGKK